MDKEGKKRDLEKGIRKTVSVVLIAMFMSSVLATMAVPSVLGDDGPLLPHSFYGNVTVNGVPAPVNTEVTGRIVGAVGSPGEGNITVNETGKYGTLDTGRLGVSTDNDNDEGKTVKFYIKLPSGAEGNATETSIFHVGGVTKLDLNVTIGVEYNLTVSSTAGGSVTEPGEGTFTYNASDVVALKAVADAGYAFVNWTGNVGTIADVNANETNITMNGNYTITANFVKRYNLTVSSTAGGNVTEPGEGTFTYNASEVVALKAVADAGYVFVNWTGDVGTIVNINANETNITMNGNYTITANFVKKRYNLTVSSTAGGNVTEPGEGTFTYNASDVVALKAVADASYVFVNWTGDVGTIVNVNANETTITMNGNYTITANFVKRVTGNIVINEIMYNPPTPESWYEWIELYNNDTKAIDVSGWVLNGTIGGSDTILSGTMDIGGYMVLAKNVSAFQARYPAATCTIIKGNWTALANSGDWVNLSNVTGNSIDSVDYPGGFSDNYSAERNRTGGWQESRVEGGTPCKVNSVCYPTVTVLYPNGGEVITIGKEENVSANATGDIAVENVTFYYSENNGTSWTKIGNGSIVPPGTAKSGTWNITWDTTGLTAGTNYSIRANATDGLLTAEDESDSTFTLEGNYTITGTTREANCSIEPNVTITVYNKTTGSAVAETTSNETGNYSVAVPDIGNYSVNASKEDFKNETQNITITEIETTYTLNFSRDYGLTPEDPPMSYALECVNHWLYPELQPEECRLSMSKALEVVNAWLY